MIELEATARQLESSRSALEGLLADYELLLEHARVDTAKKVASMHPQRAAQLICELETQAAGSGVSLLAGMQARQAGRILDQLSALDTRLTAQLVAKLTQGPKP